MKIKLIKNVKNLRGQRVLVRCDLNVALEKKKVKDDFKIIQSLPTIRFLIAQGAKIILITHLGRPAGKKVASYKLTLVNSRLTKLLGKKVKYVDDCITAKAQSAVKKMKNGQVVLLDNLRFYKGEKSNNEKFAQGLANLADIYVNDAFAVSHRAHASVDMIKKFLPAYAGLLLEQELNNLAKIINPKKPLVVIMGGAKIETKTPVIKKLAKKAKVVLIGGMISYDLLAAKGWSTGKVKVSKEQRKIAKKALSRKVILPVDFIVSNKKDGKGETNLVPAKQLPANMWQFDIGPETIRLYAQHIKKAQTIIWNGPLGMFEENKFKQGTISIARLVASVSSGKSFGVVGGGETVAALRQTQMAEYVDWVSTSGGAMLVYLAGEKMPGLKGIVK